ncbi:hypothetical protein AC578_8155 [Pseudocercospora eumusae]|uniref:WSC domain-containing protein n=1 Tax=Pseudocercospora eumusae TaxID=321146 RepID=A0A139HAC2_9PEZI|nr:hypothetical protein AC578_8155 [Pseudocercospora eumusae]
MHFTSSFVIAAGAAGLASALPTKQGLPLVGDLSGGGGGGGGGSILPFVGSLTGSRGSGLPLVDNLMGGGGPNNNQYAYGASCTSGNGGILGGIFKRDDQAKDDTHSTQHTDCVNQCTSYCQQYFQDDDHETQFEQQCPQQCSQVLTSPIQSPLGQAPAHYGGQQTGQWQPGFGGSNNGNRFPATGVPANGSPNTGFTPIQQQGGQRLADPITQPFRGSGLPNYPGSNGIASPIDNNFPGNNNNAFPQSTDLNEPAGQAFCNIFDGIHSNTGIDTGAGQPATAPLGYGAPNPSTKQVQTSPYGQSQCPLLQEAQTGQWQQAQQAE